MSERYLKSRRVIRSLEGDCIWFWPELIKQWRRESEVVPSINVEPHYEVYRVVMIGRWGRVSGVLLGVFASRDLAIQAQGLCVTAAQQTDGAVKAIGDVL